MRFLLCFLLSHLAMWKVLLGSTCPICLSVHAEKEPQCIWIFRPPPYCYAFWEIFSLLKGNFDNIYYISGSLANGVID